MADSSFEKDGKVLKIVGFEVRLPKVRNGHQSYVIEPFNSYDEFKELFVEYNVTSGVFVNPIKRWFDKDSPEAKENFLPF